MTSMLSSKQGRFLLQYTHALFCDEKDRNGKSNSLKVLENWSKRSLPEGETEDRSADVHFLIQKLPQTYRDAVRQIEAVARDYYGFTTDCHDDAFLLDGIKKMEGLIKILPPSDPKGLETRLKLYDRLYDFDENYRPSFQQYRFDVLKRAVQDIRHNDGRFDHDPLNITARRLDYFMRHVSAKERLSLVQKINAKTVDKETYNYKPMLNKLKTVSQKERSVKREEDRASQRLRYEEIERNDLYKAQTPQQKIDLYSEMLDLVDAQNWGRIQKFDTKIKLCTQLSDLYTQTGEIEERKKICTRRTKFTKALDAARTAAQKKGYKLTTGGNNNGGKSEGGFGL